MRIEDKIEILESAVRGDIYYDDDVPQEVYESALSALREKAERESNPPLTLDELRQMCQPGFKKIYDPIWIETISDGKVSCQLTRGLIKSDARFKVPKQWVNAHRVNLLLADYGKAWLAYRYRKDGE